MGDYKALFAVLDDYVDGIYYGGPRPAKSLRKFTCFTRLPFELRAQIWRHYCPALSTQPMILQFEFLSHALGALCGQSLAHQTAAVRTVLSVHRESREVALCALPDTLTFHPDRGIVHFKRERDIVLLHETVVANGPDGMRSPGPPGWRLTEGWWDGPPRSERSAALLFKILSERAGDIDRPEWRTLKGFSENVVNLALVVDRLIDLRPERACKVEYAARFCLAFPNLKFVWPCLDTHSVYSFLHAFKSIRNKDVDAIVYAPRLQDGDVNPLGRAASSIFPDDQSSWRRFLAKASVLRLLLAKAHKKEVDLDEELFTEEEWERLRGISAWPLVASYFEGRRKRR